MYVYIILAVRQVLDLGSVQNVRFRILKNDTELFCLPTTNCSNSSALRLTSAFRVPFRTGYVLSLSSRNELLIFKYRMNV